MRLEEDWRFSRPVLPMAPRCGGGSGQKRRLRRDRSHAQAAAWRASMARTHLLSRTVAAPQTGRMTARPGFRNVPTPWRLLRRQGVGRGGNTRSWGSRRTRPGAIGRSSRPRLGSLPEGPRRAFAARGAKRVEPGPALRGDALSMFLPRAYYSGCRGTMFCPLPKLMLSKMSDTGISMPISGIASMSSIDSGVAAQGSLLSRV